jgi:hypothetical protein
LTDTNGYRYAMGRPTTLADPSGLQIISGPMQPSPQGEPRPYPRFPRSGCTTDARNIRTLLEVNWCGCPPPFFGIDWYWRPRTKQEREMNADGVMTISTPIPYGPQGGFHRYCSRSHVNIGAGGCNSCIAIVIRCPPIPGNAGGVATFHFTIGDDPCSTLARWYWHGCYAIICGGNGERQSLCLAETVIWCARTHGVYIDVISGSDACGTTPSGDWYHV